MMDKYNLKLELNKIFDLLKNYCVSEIGKMAVDKLKPSNDKLIVEHLLLETDEARKLLRQNGNIPITNINDFSKIAKLLESNLILSCSDLLSIANILKISRELKHYFFNSENYDNFEHLEKYFYNLYNNSDLENNIFKSIIDQYNLSDEASPTLSILRRRKRNLEASIKDNLNKIIHSSSYSKFIMDPIITMRDNRYVIPIKVEYKDKLKGFVHDISFSGSTVYIEPISVFELNNDINNLQLEENIEIEKILKNLSENIFPLVNNIQISLEALSNLDLIFAKAKYSNDFDCSIPIISDSKIINLKNARHPLIDSSKVIPIDVEIGLNFSTLIITGPNTGGKTVTLKTVGLLCLMAYIGLHIPTKENSTLYVFDNIFADIGDEQSIQESLSTFSSHMLNIIDIYNLSTDKSLILLDELGSGTDPIEGSSLAISILEHFNNLGALSLVTTHYQEIKNYALVTDGFENASSEFDIENLKPTYKLLIGVPGKSNAFAITKKLGMPDSILNRAQTFLTNDHINIEQLIKNIYDDKIKIEQEKEKILQNSNQIELLRKNFDNKNNQIQSKQNEIIEKAKIQAREILLNAKKNANSIISDLNKLYNDPNPLKQANAIRNKLNDNIKNISNLDNNTFTDESIKIDDIKIGMNVLVKTLNRPRYYYWST